MAGNDFIHVDMNVFFGFLAFAYSVAVVLYDVAVIIILKKKIRSDNGIVKSQIVDCFNEGLQLVVTLGAMTLITLFPESLGIYRFQYIICLVIIGYCFYASLEPITSSVNSLLDKCLDEKMSRKILKALTANFELYQFFETLYLRIFVPN